MFALDFFVPVHDHPLGQLKLPARSFDERELAALLALARQRLTLRHLCTIGVSKKLAFDETLSAAPEDIVTARLPNRYLVRRRRVKEHMRMLGGWETVQPVAVKVRLPLQAQALGPADAPIVTARLAPLAEAWKHEVVLVVDSTTEYDWLPHTPVAEDRALMMRAWELLAGRLRRQPGWLLRVAQTHRWRGV